MPHARAVGLPPGSSTSTSRRYVVRGRRDVPSPERVVRTPVNFGKRANVAHKKVVAARDALKIDGEPREASLHRNLDRFRRTRIEVQKTVVIRYRDGYFESTRLSRLGTRVSRSLRFTSSRTASRDSSGPNTFARRNAMNPRRSGPVSPERALHPSLEGTTTG